MALFTPSDAPSLSQKWLQLIVFWEEGLWNPPLLVFAVQMMLMLVLGHALALSAPVDRLLRYFVARFCGTAAGAAFSICFFTVLVGLYNWGLGLIFGAIFARKAGEFAARNQIATNYALLGAAGYSGMMVWHGGFSGSSLAKVAEEGHILQMAGSNPGMDLPVSIPYSETVFGAMNITVSLLLIILLPLGMYFLMKRSKLEVPKLSDSRSLHVDFEVEAGAADSLDRSRFIALVFGGLIFFTALYKAYTHPGFSDLSFISPNWINLSLLGLGMVFHARFDHFLKAVDDAIGGAAAILIQFPLYFGIMGVMSGSGLVSRISEGFVAVCERSGYAETLYPILTFFSAGLINIFVPSGGGQWAVQGPIIIQAASEMGIPLTKSIMAMAYGDQLTNMLQPFWALPLLAITGLKARDVLPFTLFLMLLGLLIFSVALLAFP